MQMMNMPNLMASLMESTRHAHRPHLTAHQTIDKVMFYLCLFFDPSSTQTNKHSHAHTVHYRTQTLYLLAGLMLRMRKSLRSKSISSRLSSSSTNEPTNQRNQRTNEPFNRTNRTNQANQNPTESNNFTFQWAQSRLEAPWGRRSKSSS